MKDLLIQLCIQPCPWYHTRGCRLLFLIPKPVLFCPTSTSHSDQLRVRGFFLSSPCASRVSEYWICISCSNLAIARHFLPSLLSVSAFRCLNSTSLVEHLLVKTMNIISVRTFDLSYLEIPNVFKDLPCFFMLFSRPRSSFFMLKYSLPSFFHVFCYALSWDHTPCYSLILLTRPIMWGLYHRRYPQSKGNITWLEEEYAISSILDSILLTIFGFFRARL